MLRNNSMQRLPGHRRLQVRCSAIIGTGEVLLRTGNDTVRGCYPQLCGMREVRGWQDSATAFSYKTFLMEEMCLYVDGLCLLSLLYHIIWVS